MAEKLSIEKKLDDLTQKMSNLVRKPCKWTESDIRCGGGFQIYTVEEGGCLVTDLLGCAKYDTLLKRFAIFRRAWFMALETEKNKTK